MSSHKGGNAALLEQISRLDKAIEEQQRRQEDKARHSALKRPSKNKKLVVQRGINVSGDASDAKDEWVKTSGRHLQLVNATKYDRQETLKLEAIKTSREAALITKKRKKEEHAERRKWRKEAAVAKRRVIVAGVLFERDPSGRKLVRREDLEQPGSSPKSPSTFKAEATPKSIVIDGTRYLRSKRGNLIPARLIKQYENRSMDTAGSKGRNKTVRPTKKPDRLCVFYTKYGLCKRDAQCPYQHDGQKRSLCHLVLKGKCTHQDNPEECLLSHNADVYRTSHCRDYATGGSCPRGERCPFPHVDLKADAKVCRDFAVLGYCDRGDRCDKRHVNECPNFVNSGKCARPKCHLPHVVRASLTGLNAVDEAPLVKKEVSSQKRPMEGQSEVDLLAEQDDFVFFESDSDGSMEEKDTRQMSAEAVDDEGYIPFGDIDSDEMMSQDGHSSDSVDEGLSRLSP